MEALVFTPEWHTSERRHGIRQERDVAIPLDDGVSLDADVLRPDSDGRFPIILSVHAYSKADQLARLEPEAFSHARGHMEAGDSAFFVRRGYVHIILNMRGTGGSGGTYDNMGPRSIEDIAQAIAWAAAQPWSSGSVGMFGVSYFAIVQARVATLHPPALKCIFAPFGWSDMYRDRYYHGGILSHGFMKVWVPTLDNPRIEGECAFADDENTLQATMADADIADVPFLANALAEVSTNPRERSGASAMIADVLTQPFDASYYRERSVDYATRPSVPAYFGGCWGVYGLHLPGAFRNWQHWAGPKRMAIGPPVYLDRPLYQYHHEALRWFDHWLKGMDTGLDHEEPIQLFIDGTGEWKGASSWPLPQTRFTAFHLHENGVLSEREPAPDATPVTFHDAPHAHGEARFWSPPMVEATELCGPMVCNLHLSTCDDDALVFVSILHRSAEGKERLLTRGWLRASQRALDETRSLPWQPHHRHDRRDVLQPGVVYELNIEVRPYAILLKPGEQIGLRIKCADDDAPANALEAINIGHLHRARAATVNIHTDANHASHLILPITRGNRIGTYLSGGKLPPI